MFTTAVAFDSLGEEHRFRTRAYGNLSGGTVTALNGSGRCYIGWDGGGELNITGGLAMFKHLRADGQGGVHVSVSAEWPWEGKIRFDLPRHSEYFNMPDDYPRLNQFPEWFTVAEGATYTFQGQPCSGAALRDGLAITLDGKSVLERTIARTR